MLAAYSPTRQPKFPDIPTLKELGYDLPEGRTHLILAPKGVPEPILKILEDAFSKAVRHDAFKAFLKNLFLEPDYRNREAIRSLIEAEYKAWDELLDKLGLKVK
jgi:tripartite-type tricarboxylate transporter receptor subunit TctC